MTKADARVAAMLVLELIPEELRYQIYRHNLAECNHTDSSIFAAFGGAPYLAVDTALEECFEGYIGAAERLSNSPATKIQTIYTLAEQIKERLRASQVSPCIQHWPHMKGFEELEELERVHFSFRFHVVTPRTKRGMRREYLTQVFSWPEGEKNVTQMHAEVFATLFPQKGKKDVS